MTRLRRLASSPVAAALLLALLAVPLAAPILRGAPCSDDFSFHLLRLAQLDALLEQGTFYSRWAPDMALGFGFPLFNFYAPLSYYVAALVSQVAPDLQFGLRLTLALGIWGAGLGAYLLARDTLNRPAALAAATAYMTAPYLGYDIYFRGNLAESLAWVWLPPALWTLGRFVRRRRRRGGSGWLAAASLTYAAVLLTHNVFALIFSPVLALFGLSWWWGARQETGARRRLAGVALALLLGICLAAFFWLPALVERSLVFSDRLLTPPDFVYQNNFITLREIFAAPRVSYSDLINPSPPRALGLVSALLALPALFALGTPGPRRQLSAAAAATLLGAVFLMLAPSAFIWERVPLLEFVQFPWRLLGPAALGLALLVGVAVDVTTRWLAARESGRLSAAAGVLPLVLLLPASLVWFTPRYCPTPVDPTAADIVRFEQESGTIGTTSAGEYLPRTVTRYPDAPADAPFTWPDDVVVAAQARRAVGLSAHVSAPRPFTAVANLFDYPGWQVLIDGAATASSPTAETGLVSFAVPAGPHTIDVRWRETPLRRAANGISLLSLGLVAALSVAAVANRRHRAPDPEDLPASESPWPAWLAAGTVVFLLLAVVPRLDSPLRRPLLANGALPAGLTPVGLDFGDGLRLEGYWIEPAGENEWRIDLVWRADAGPTRPYQTTVTLVDAAGLLWSDKASARPRDHRPPYDTRSWLPGDMAIDSHLVTVLPGTPPGAYTAALTIFDRETLALLAPLGSIAAPVPLEAVRVNRPVRPPDPAALSWQVAADAAWSGVALLGYNLDRAAARPGDPFQLTLFWTATADPAADLAARVFLTDAAGAEVFEITLPPARADWPTSTWRTGDLWRGQHAWRLPAALPGGELAWRLQLCPGTGRCDAPVVRLGTLTVDEPPRTRVLPPVALELDAAFGGIARLAGATTRFDESTGELTVTLVWEALAESGTSYRVFVHLLDDAGTLLAQSDGEPAGWTRPTTGWLPGEFIVDEHRLRLPGAAGDLRLAIGLYDPATGTRLRTPAAPEGDRLLLPPFPSPLRMQAPGEG